MSSVLYRAHFLYVLIFLTLKSVHIRRQQYKTPNLSKDRGFVVLVAGLAPLAARPAPTLLTSSFAVKLCVVKTP